VCCCSALNLRHTARHYNTLPDRVFLWFSLYCSLCCSALQCVAMCCSVLQCVAVCCSVLHGISLVLSLLFAMSPHTHAHVQLYQAATHCNSLRVAGCIFDVCNVCFMSAVRDWYKQTHCNTLQRTATHCNTLMSAMHVSCLQSETGTSKHTATHCNTLQHTATHTKENSTHTCVGVCVCM